MIMLEWQVTPQHELARILIGFFLSPKYNRFWKYFDFPKFIKGRIIFIYYIYQFIIAYG